MLMMTHNIPRNPLVVMIQKMIPSSTTVTHHSLKSPQRVYNKATVSDFIRCFRKESVL